MNETNEIIHGDCLDILQDIATDSIDCVVTDPPYGMSFMGKNWDKAVPSVAIWQECLRVLKPGAFAFVMCIPRQDCLAHMIVNLSDAGLNVAFSSIYWTYASGFPKAQNVSKQIDKRAGAKREIVGEYQCPDGKTRNWKDHNPDNGVCFKNVPLPYNKEGLPITAPATSAAKQFDGAYSGFQPKPAVEIVIVAMKPLSEKTYVDQALQNGHGCTWLDNCRIPYENDSDKEKSLKDANCNRQPKLGSFQCSNELIPDKTNIKKGRFPANVLCEDDVLNDGIERKSGAILTHYKRSGKSNLGKTFEIRDRTGEFADWQSNSGEYSRYFSLDAWFVERIKQLPPEAQKTFPWLIVPKASKSEKNRGCEDVEGKVRFASKNKSGAMLPSKNIESHKIKGNYHPTTKPLKLLSWLITLGTREGDVVLDPFVGSGTTCIAAKALGREYIGIEREEDYVEIVRKRVAAIPASLFDFDKKS